MIPPPGQSILSPKASLAAIITAARAGGLRHAWSLFEAGGYASRTDDPAALAVKGRLLKDDALRTPAEHQPAAFARAAAAYAAADALSPQPYTAINVATLNRLAGNRDAATAAARRLLAALDCAHDIAETPYYLAAIRAEALLLCGDEAGAQRAMQAAIAAQPDGWVDHASTLRQLDLIIRSDSVDAGVDGSGGAAWLDAFRPPRSLHFAGHLGVAEADCAALAASVDAAIAAERIGFGFGALAAGSDIVIAERLLAAGCALAVILPTGVEDFARQSVVPFGVAWRARFDACLAAAQSLTVLTQFDDGYQPLATALAADVAMGAAVLDARLHASSAVQLLVIDEGPGPYGRGLETARIGKRWVTEGRRQQLVRWPRNAPVPASGSRTVPEGASDLRLLALLHIELEGFDRLDDAGTARAMRDVVHPFRQAARALMPAPLAVWPQGNAVIAAFADPELAWNHARGLLALPTGDFALRIAAHFAVVHAAEPAASIVGRGVSELLAVASGALPGVVTASATFAQALHIGGPAGGLVEPVGMIGDAPLFAIGPAAPAAVAGATMVSR